MNPDSNQQPNNPATPPSLQQQQPYSPQQTTPQPPLPQQPAGRDKKLIIISGVAAFMAILIGVVLFLFVFKGDDSSKSNKSDKNSSESEEAQNTDDENGDEEEAESLPDYKTFENKCFTFEYPETWSDQDVVADADNCSVALPNYSQIEVKVNRDRSETQNFSDFDNIDEAASYWGLNDPQKTKLDGLDARIEKSSYGNDETTSLIVLTTSKNYGARGFKLFLQPISSDYSIFKQADVDHMIETWQWKP